MSHKVDTIPQVLYARATAHWSQPKTNGSCPSLPLGARLVYDARSSTTISGFLWDSTVLENHTKRVDAVATLHRPQPGDTLESKARLLDILPLVQLQLPMLALSGSSTFLQDWTLRTNVARVSLWYGMRCEWTELDVLSSFLAEKANADALSAGLATHVVSAILWGRDAVVAFEREAHETALSEVQASLLHDVEIARSRLTNSTAGHPQPVNVAGVHIFADTAGSDDISVTTMEGSLQYLQNLPSCGEGQMVPVAAKLFPLSAFGSQASQASINDTAIRLAFQTLEDLHASAKEVGDLLVKHPTSFHAWEEDVATLQTQFEHYSDDIQTRIARTHPAMNSPSLLKST